MKNFFRINLLKTIYFNLRLFKFKTAIKLPIVIGWHFKIRELHKGTVVLNVKPKCGLVKIGCGEGVFGVEPNKHSYWIVKKGSKIIFNGPCGFSKGASFRCGDNGTIEFGKGVHFAQNFFIACNTSIYIGDDVIGGWNIHVQDADGHTIFNKDTGEEFVERKPITIKDHVWIGYNANFLKGSFIDSHSVVGSSSVVTKSFEGNPNVVLAGVPAKIVKENIDWRI